MENLPDMSDGDGEPEEGEERESGKKSHAIPRAVSLELGKQGSDRLRRY